MNDKPLFTISIAANLLKTHPRTLMAYEREKLISPYRSGSKRRIYSQNDIDRIQFIQFLTQKKSVNLAGVKIIIDAIKRAKKNNLDLKKELFPEFKLKKLY